MKIAFFGAPAPTGRVLDESDEGLVGELVRLAEVGIFHEGLHESGAPAAASIAARCRRHDLAQVHYRNRLHEYDVVVYTLTSPRSARLEEILGEWPGVVIARDPALEARLASEPPLRRVLLDRSLALLVGSASVATRLREADPTTAIVVAECLDGPFDELARGIVEACRGALRREQGWLRTLLKTASAEIPGYVPGDRDAPWRAEIDELVELVDLAGKEPSER
jgi:hypothetical protein